MLRDRRARRRGRRVAVALAVFAVVASACGTRLDHADLEAAAFVEVGGPETGAARPRSGTGGADPAAGGPAGPTATTSPGAGTVAGGDAGGDDAVGPNEGGTTVPGQQPSGDKLFVATVGNYSGIAGATLGDYPAILGAWASDVNRAGGINGRPVEVIAVDDGGDPARHRALLKELVEDRGVVAFVANMAPLTGASGVEYLNQKRVPVIGGTIADSWYATSAMHFPHGSYFELYYEASLIAWAPTLKAAGQTNFATFACSEAASCEAGARIWGERAEAHGLDHVYAGQASLASPDYTAQCLAMRNAGAEAVALGFDVNSVHRIAASCARQGYRPRFLGVGTITAIDFPEDPNLDGYIVAAPVFPWTDASTPARKRFRDAMTAAGLSPSPNGADAWTAAVLFETVARRAAEPTSAAIIAELYAMDGDDLGGLTGPLRFRPDQPPPLTACGAGVMVREGDWVGFGDGGIVCG